MKINEQLQNLIDEAPQHGVPAAVMEASVTPALKRFAQKLQHSHYYVLHSSDPFGDGFAARAWVITTLSHREQPQRQKRVIYAFATRKDATSWQGIASFQGDILSVPVTHMLFDLFACDRVDSIIFLETPGNIEQGKEIARSSLQNIIQKQLKQLKPSPSQKIHNIPSNFA